MTRARRRRRRHPESRIRRCGLRSALARRRASCSPRCSTKAACSRLRTKSVQPQERHRRVFTPLRPRGAPFRIRPGTAVAVYTRLVFDMHGSGLPTMIITRPDDLHVVVTFKGTNVAGAPVNGISSYHVTAGEPGLQQGPDGTITIDLARPVRVTAFTLPATGGYAWRLVVDLHTS